MYNISYHRNIYVYLYNMRIVQPIREPTKIANIKQNLKKLENPRDYLLFVFGINTALRISDILKLNVGDVLDKNGKIKKILHVQEQKTKRQARISLNEAITDALERFFDKNPPTDYDKPLFISKRSTKRLDRTQSWRLINKWCREVGLTSERYGNHSLRKSFGYMARKYNGYSIELIQKKLGHRSPDVTRAYIGITQDEVEDMEMKMNL